jgi:hypothetical protein
MQTEIPAVAVLLPTGLMLMLGAWLVLRSRAAVSGPRLLTARGMCWYVLGVVGVTLLPLQIQLGRYANQVPWYTKADIIPLVTIDLRTFVLNIVMTFPLGLLLPLVIGSVGSGTLP